MNDSKMNAANGDQELEVKFFDVNLDAIRSRLIKIGAQAKHPERLMRRTVFGGEQNPGMICTYGRVRDEGNVITMSAKYSAVNGDISSQREAQITVDSYENACAVLTAFGLKATNHQENTRETWELSDGTLVELEHWPELPTYIEIEGPSVAALEQTAKLLELDWSLHTTDSTDKLYQKFFSLDSAETQKKISNLQF